MNDANETLEQIKKLAQDRENDSAAQTEWDELVHEYDRKTGKVSDYDGMTLEAKRAFVIELAKFKYKRENGEAAKFDLFDELADDPCAGVSPCGDRGGGGGESDNIDLEHLAELVFERLIFEVRVERERVGWAA